MASPQSLEQMHGVGAEKPQAPRTVPPQLPRDSDQADQFSPLDLRDRVVIMSIFYEIVRLDQVERAWRRWHLLQQHSAELALWRVLVRDPEVAHEAVYEVAAQIYGFEEAEVNRLRAQALIRDVSGSFSEAQWQRMFELLVAPIAVGEDPRTGHARLIFATHDPTRPEVTRLLQQLALDGFELRYAAADQITELFTEIFGESIRELFLDEAPGEVLPEALPAPSKAPPAEGDALDSRSLVDWFEGVLVATYRQRATEARLFINPERALEIHLCIGGQMTLWRTETALHPEGLFAYVTDDIIKVDQFVPEAAMEVTFQRWIDRDLTRFQLRMQPADDSEELSAATVVIRVLGHRETSSEGLGPWRSH